MLGSALIAAPSAGQPPNARPAVVRGFILADSTEEPLVGAEVSIDALKLRALSVDRGAFRIGNIAPGTYIVSIRVIGYQPLSTRLHFADGDSLERDFLLLRSPVAIAGVRVTGTSSSTRNPKLAQMERRRAMGIGHFITPERLDSFPDTRLSVHLQTLPGLSIAHGNGSTATWAVGTRGSGSIIKTPAISSYDRARGAKSVCYSAVYLDGIVVYGGKQGETLFDIDQLDTRTVAAVEYYASEAQMPPELNMTTSGTCGVLVIWTK